MTRLALAFLLGLVLLSPVQAKPDERALIEKSWKMLEWIERKTDYSIEHIEIRFTFRTADELWRMIYGEQERPDETFAVHAAFLAGTIILDERFRLGLDDALLFHELVHLVQHHNAADFPCPGLREKEAYDLQHEYAHTHSGYIVNDFFQIPFNSCADW